MTFNTDRINDLVAQAKKAKMISKKDAAFFNLITGVADLLSSRVGGTAPQAKNKKPGRPGDYIEYEEVK